jgi:4-hydroxy-tetrahydrodipicolinate synthase
MTLAQRKRVAEICLERANGKVTVMTQVGDEAIESIRELAKHAADIGIDGIAALTPYYYKPDNDAVLDYYRAVGTFTDLPLFIYHIPPNTGLSLTARTIAHIMNEVPEVRGIKDSSGDFKHLLEILYYKPKGIAVFSGSDEYALAGLISGMDGCVTGYASAFPENYVKLLNLFREGKIEKAVELQETMTRIKLLLKSPPIQPIKEALKLRGLNGGYVKKPLRFMTPMEVRELGKSLKEMKAV